MKLLFALLLASLLTACATAPGTTPGAAASSSTEAAAAAPVPTGVRWQYINSKSYDALNAGLGNSHRHESSVGWVDVYVYDMKRTDWQPGVSDPQFDEHFKGTLAEVQRAVAQGSYSSAKVGPTRDVRIEGLTFRSVSFRIVHARDGKAYDSYTYLTARNGRLLKYRMSFYSPAPANVEAIAREFIERNIRTGPDTPAGTRALRST